MYLSCLLIDTGENPDRPRPGRLWLRNLYHVHQRLCMAFPSAERAAADPHFLKPWDPADFPEQRHLADRPTEEVGLGALRQVHAPRDDRRGFLFRIDPQPRARVAILVQSALEPDWDYAFHNAGYLLAAAPEVKPFSPRFTMGQHLDFRLLANPTRKIDTKTRPNGERSNGNRLPVSDDQLYPWLARRADAAGFTVDEAATTIHTGYVYVNKAREDRGQRLRSARFDGLLEVTDPQRLVEAVASGIGSGKAFGFGLLSLARA